MIAGFYDKQLAHSLFIDAIAGSCAQCNMSRQALFRGTGLFDDALCSNTLVSASQLIRLLQNVVKLRRQPDTGFIIGHQLAALSQQSHTLFLQHSINGSQWVRAATILASDILPLLQIRRYNTDDGDYFVFSGIAAGQSPGSLIPDSHLNLHKDTHKLKLDTHYQSLLLQIVFTALTVLVKQWHGKKLPLQFMVGRTNTGQPA